MNRDKGSFFLTALFTFVLLVMLGGLFYYNSYLKDNLGEQTCGILDEIMHQQLFNFDSKLHSDKKMIEAFVHVIANASDKKNIMDTLKIIEEHSDFDNAFYIMANGMGYNQDGVSVDISDRAYFRDVMQGRTVISEPLASKIRDANIIVTAAPVVKDGKVVGVLAASYETSSLDELFLSSFGGDGYAYVVNNSGDVIARTTNTYSLVKGNNVFGVWGKADFYMYDDFNTIKANFVNNKGGHSRYNLLGQNRLLHYATIGTNSWNILSVVPEQSIEKISNKIINASTALTAIVALLAFVFSFFSYREQKRHIKALTQMAYFDELTGAPNFNMFKINASELLKNNPHTKYVVGKVDIDEFKLINDIYGRDTGDDILKLMANTFELIKDPLKDTYCRLSADQFLVFIGFDTVEESEEKRTVFDNAIDEGSLALINQKLLLRHGRYILSNDEKDIDEMFERVNFAHKLAKASRMKMCDYDKELKARLLKDRDIENRMEDALANGEFCIVLQPKYRLIDERIAGAEALVRWSSGGAFFSSPNEFIRLFEKNEFIIKIDMYIFEKACVFLRRLMDENIALTAISVNFSRLHLKNIKFVSELCKVADKYAVPRKYLDIELTESTMLGNEEALIKVLDELHEEGFLLSMDDFGTGYSSLGLLKNIPIDTIKLDRSFFVSANDDKRARSVVKNVINIAKDLGIYTVAEGVEEKRQIDMLREMGCDTVQGYYYAKPMPEDDFYKLLTS